MSSMVLEVMLLKPRCQSMKQFLLYFGYHIIARFHLLENIYQYSNGSVYPQSCFFIVPKHLLNSFPPTAPVLCFDCINICRLQYASGEVFAVYTAYNHQFNYKTLVTNPGSRCSLISQTLLNNMLHAQIKPGLNKLAQSGLCLESTLYAYGRYINHKHLSCKGMALQNTPFNPSQFSHT